MVSLSPCELFGSVWWVVFDSATQSDPVTPEIPGEVGGGR